MYPCTSLCKWECLDSLIICPRILPTQRINCIIVIMALIKQEPMEEEMQLSTSGGGEHKGEVEGSDFDSDQEFDDSFIEEYCEQDDIPGPMTIWKELFYTDTMVKRRYAQLSPLIR